MSSISHKLYINIEHALSIHYHIDINMIQIEVDSKSVQNVPNKK